MPIHRYSQVMAMLIEKSRLQYHEIDKPIVEFPHRLIKGLEILKKDHQQDIDDLSLRLKGKQKELYKLLRNQETKNLQPQTVAEVIISLDSQQEKRRIEDKRKKMKNILETTQKKIEIELEEINKLRKSVYKKATGIPFLFDEKLCNTKIYTILNSGKQVNHTENNQQYHFSLISPSVSVANESKITLKMLYINRWIFVGMARKQIFLKYNGKWPENSEGIYLIASLDGKVHNHLDLNQHSMQSNFRFNIGDEVEMQYKKIESVGCEQHCNQHKLHSQQHTQQWEKFALLYWNLLGGQQGLNSG